MPKIENSLSISKLALRDVAQRYWPTQRYQGNPYFPADVEHTYGTHFLELVDQIKHIDIARGVHLKKVESPDFVTYSFDPEKARLLALTKFAPFTTGELYVLPAFIENDEEKYAFYKALKLKQVEFTFTLSVVERMNSLIGRNSLIFTRWVEQIQEKTSEMDYDAYAEFLTKFFNKYPTPFDYIYDYIQNTGDVDVLKYALPDQVQKIVIEELLNLWEELETDKTEILTLTAEKGLAIYAFSFQ